MLLVAIKYSVKNINKDSLCMHFARDPALRRSLKGTQKHLLNLKFVLKENCRKFFLGVTKYLKKVS